VAEGVVTSSDAEFRQILERRGEPVREIATAARALLYELYPATVEVVWVPQGNSGYGVGTKKMSEQWAWLVPASKHVALAIPFGASLDDPDGLLQGTGASVRNVRLSSADDVGSPALRALLIRAIARVVDAR
jgi:hypothetical protein